MRLVFASFVVIISCNLAPFLAPQCPALPNAGCKLPYHTGKPVLRRCCSCMQCALPAGATRRAQNGAQNKSRRKNYSSRNHMHGTLFVPAHSPIINTRSRCHSPASNTPLLHLTNPSHLCACPKPTAVIFRNDSLRRTRPLLFRLRAPSPNPLSAIKARLSARPLLSFFSGRLYQKLPPL